MCPDSNISVSPATTSGSRMMVLFHQMRGSASVSPGLASEESMKRRGVMAAARRTASMILAPLCAVAFMASLSSLLP